MIWLGEILLLLVNIAMAYHHSELIKDDKPIKHGWWGLSYFVLAVVMSIFSSWWLLLAAMLIRKVFFDLSLNLFRGKPLFYVSSTSTSIIDRIHYKIFGNKSEIYMSIYFVLLILVNIFLL